VNINALVPVTSENLASVFLPQFCLSKFCAMVSSTSFWMTSNTEEDSIRFDLPEKEEKRDCTNTSESIQEKFGLCRICTSHFRARPV
jgi:hypothetical protein